MLNTFSKEYTAEALRRQGRPASHHDCSSDARSDWRGPAIAFLHPHGAGRVRSGEHYARNSGRGKATASQSGHWRDESGISETRLRAVQRRLALEGWRPGIDMIAAQPDPVCAETVHVRLLAPPPGGRIVLILEYADGSGMAFTQGLYPKNLDSGNRAQRRCQEVDPGMGEKGDVWS